MECLSTFKYVVWHFQHNIVWFSLLFSILSFLLVEILSAVFHWLWQYSMEGMYMALSLNSQCLNPAHVVIWPVVIQCQNILWSIQWMHFYSTCIMLWVLWSCDCLPWKTWPIKVSCIVLGTGKTTVQAHTPGIKGWALWLWNIVSTTPLHWPLSAFL